MIQIYKKFFKNKKVLITGNTGFKGTWLTHFHILFGSKILGISNNFVSNPSIFKILKTDKKIKNKKIDILDFKNLKKNIVAFKPNYIFHLAAQSLVSYSHKYPKETFETNFNGTLNILEIAKNLKSLKGIIIVTSDKCYDINHKKKKISESDPLGGNDPYSSSKGSTEILLKPYFHIFRKKNIAISSVRAGNVIGGGDWGKDRLIPDIIRSIKNKKELIVRNPNHIRPWQHVFDCLNGYVLLMTKQVQNPKKYSGSYNIGPNNLTKIRVKNIVKIFLNNFKFKYKYKNKNILGETKILRLNTYKSKKVLNFSNKLTLNKSIDLTINWYKNYLNKQNMKVVTEKQIKDYFKK